MSWDKAPPTKQEMSLAAKSGAPVKPGASWDELPPDANQPGMLESLARGAAQGATFGFGDELVGALEGGYNTLTGDKPLSIDAMLANYTKSRDESRAANKKAEAANPLSYLGGNLAGAIAPALLTGGASAGAEAAGLGAKIAQGAKLGLGTGVLTGAGMSEGDNVTDVAKDAAMGGVLGGVGGAVIPVAGAALGKGAEKVGETLSNATTGAKNFLANRVEDAADSSQTIRDTLKSWAMGRGPQSRPSYGEKALDRVTEMGQDTTNQIQRVLKKYNKAAGMNKIDALANSEGRVNLEKVIQDRLDEMRKLPGNNQARIKELEDLLQNELDPDLFRMRTISDADGNPLKITKSLNGKAIDAESPIPDNFTKTGGGVTEVYTPEMAEDVVSQVADPATTKVVGRPVDIGDNKVAMQQKVDALNHKAMLEGSGETYSLDTNTNDGYYSILRNKPGASRSVVTPGEPTGEMQLSQVIEDITGQIEQAGGPGKLSDLSPKEAEDYVKLLREIAYERKEAGNKRIANQLKLLAGQGSDAVEAAAPGVDQLNSQIHAGKKALSTFNKSLAAASNESSDPTAAAYKFVENFGKSGSGARNQQIDKFLEQLDTLDPKIKQAVEGRMGNVFDEFDLVNRLSKGTAVSNNLVGQFLGPLIKAIPKGANLAARTLTKAEGAIAPAAEKVSSIVTRSPEALASLASRLQSSSDPQAQKLANVLTQAETRDRVGRNALLFALEQNPQYRELLRQHDESVQ
jgi:hypothetical protein